MKTLSIDIETYSDVDIKCGVYKYVDSPNFKILLLAYSYEDAPVKIIDLTKDEVPIDLLFDITCKNVLKTAYNASFEIACISKHFGIYIDPYQWECTMVKAMMLSLPAGLAKTVKALGLEVEKDTSGKNLIKYFSMPCKPTKVNGGRTINLPCHDLEKWERFKKYCIQDVVVEKAIRDKLDFYKIPKIEHDLWVQDILINTEGVKLDAELVNSAVKINEDVKTNALSLMKDLTGLDNPNSTPQLKSWVEAKIGYELENLNKATVSELLESCTSPDVLEVLRLKQSTSKTSTSKYVAAQKAVCSDGKIRGTLQYYGASRTGRWAGRVVQVHNLPQNHLKDLDTAVKAIKTGDWQLVHLLYGYVQNTLSELIRTMFVANKGKTFAIADFSAIEARVIAWLSNENWRLKVFKTHGKIYEASASQMFNVPIEKITKGSELRQKGKVAELALGYGGSVGALTQIGALKGGLKEEELKPLVDAWRNASPNIKRLWHECNSAALNAVEGYPSEVNGIKFKREKGFLFIKLPSGRRLAYPQPRIVLNRFGGESVGYMDFDKDKIIDTYGGKLVENIVQAIARDCLASNLLKLERAGYDIKFHVHDEVIVEVDKENAEQELKNIEDIMAVSPSWAEDLPLKADGYITEYYKKD